MASEHGETPRSPGAKGDQPLSFVQRLQRHFGPDVDPRIDLQAEEGSESPAEGREDSGSTALQDFVKRLSPTLEGGRFEIKQEVASGGMGTILRVWDGDLRRNLAMKVMHGRGSGSGVAAEGSTPVDPERLGRFLEEAQITGQLDHPGVVPVHDLGIDSKGQCYFTMRFVRGAELKNVLDLYRAGEEGWTRTKVLGVVLKVCEAMAYAHSKGVVHRDLKPSNVMVGRFGETYVMDWGLARVLGRRDSHDLRLKPHPEDASALSLVRTVRRDETEQNPESPLVTMDGDVIGTPSYMAPEQARGRLEEVGPRSDVYSLGAILYYMLTGQAPYVKTGERVSPHVVLGRVLDAPPMPVEKLNPHEPAELVAICTKAMERDPELRYGSMLEVADDIQAFLENRVVRAYERGSLAEFKKWVVRNKGMAAGLAGMITLALASAGFFAWRREKEFDALEKKEKETSAAKYEAEENLRRATDSEQLAKDNLELANERRAEADRQTKIAQSNEATARRSGYAANILAADYSLRTNEIAEARERLRAAEGDLRGWEWRHLALKASAPLAMISRFTVAGVEGLAFQPGENRALVLTGHGHAKVWDLTTMREVPPDGMTARKDLVSSLLAIIKNLAMDVNAQGTQVALVGAETGVQVFDLETGERPAGVPQAGLVEEGSTATVLAVAFSPNGRYLATGDSDGQILVRDALNWEILRRLPGHVAQVTGLAWSPGSDRLASSSRDGSVRVWDFETGRGLDSLRGHRGPVRGVVWDDLGEHLFSAGEDGAVHMWEAGTGRVLRSFNDHEGAVTALDYDPVKNRLVTASTDRTVRVWDVQRGTSIALRGHEAPVVEVAFDPLGERVLSGDTDGVVYLWAAEGDLASTELLQHREQVNALAFDPSGSRLVSAANDHELVLWDAHTGEPLRRLRDHESFVNSVSWSADGRTFLTGSHDQTAILWDAETGRPLRRFGPFDRWVVGAALTPDSSRAIVATGDRKVRVLDAETRLPLRELAGSTSSADALAVGAGGHLVATVGRELVVWDLASDSAEPLYVHKGRNSAVAISPDETRIATGGLYGLVQVFEAQKGDLLAGRQEQSKRIHALAWSPDSRRLASASEEGEIHVREAESGESLLVLREPRGAVTALAFSADGSRLATGMRDGTVRIHETTPASERRDLRRAAEARTSAAQERVDELFAERFLLASVLEGLETDRGLTQELREAALRLAYLRGDDPEPLLASSLAECLEPEQPESVYAFALERATQAESLIAAATKERTDVLPSGRAAELQARSKLVRGTAFYRMKRFSDAADLLAVPEATPDDDAAPTSRLPEREEALRLLFLCMTQCQTAEHKAAELSWRRAQQSVLNDTELSQSEELSGLLAEAETLVRSSAPPSGS